MPATAAEADVLAAAKRALDATNAFDKVYLGALPDVRGQSSRDLAAAAVLPLQGTAAGLADHSSSGPMLCRMTFSLVVMARAEGEEERYREAGRLLSIAENAINGRALADLTHPATTRVSAWTWERDSAPERRVRATVSCDYLVPSWTGFNTDR
jgi:hypothetical protein